MTKMHVRNITGLPATLDKFDDFARQTVVRAMAEVGITVVAGSFEKGAVVTSTNEGVYQESTGKVYSWFTDATITVPAGTSPQNFGGINATAWSDKTDLTLRSDLEAGGKTINDLANIYGYVDSLCTEVYAAKYLSVAADFSAAVQLAIDEARGDVTSSTQWGKVAGKVVLPRGRFPVSRPWLLYENDGIEVVGQGKFATQLYPTTDMLYGALPADWQALPDDYNKQALFLVAKRRITAGANGVFIPDGAAGAARFVNFSSFSFIASGTAWEKQISLVYSPAMSHATIHDVYAQNHKYAFDVAGFYRINMYDTEFENCVGFTTAQSGTSLSISGSGMTRSTEGWKLYGINYTSLNNVSLDHWAYGYYGWDFEQCLNVSLTGCGMEKGLGGSFRVVGHRCAVNFQSCNISAGALVGADNYTGQTQLSDFGVTRFALVQGAVLRIGSGCSVRHEYSTDGGVTISQFPVITDNYVYETNKLKGAKVEIGALSDDAYGAKFRELFPSTTGLSVIKNLDPLATITCVLKSTATQAIGANATYNVGFPSAVSDVYSLYDSVNKKVVCKHGGRALITANLRVYGTAVAYVAIVVAGVETYLLQTNESTTIDQTISATLPVNVVAGSEISLVVRAFAGGSATVDADAGINVSYL